MIAIVGVDPGATGGISVVTTDRSFASLRSASSTDRDTVESLMTALAEARFVSEGNILAVVEKVASFPGQGAVSTFTFGRRYGIVQGVLLASGIEFHHVQPKTWQKSLGLTLPPKVRNPLLTAKEKRKIKSDRRKAQKLAGLSLASSIYKNLEALDEETADGILLAEYGIRQWCLYGDILDRRGKD